MLKQVTLSPRLCTENDLEDVFNLTNDYLNSGLFTGRTSVSEVRLRGFIGKFLRGDRRSYLPLGLYKDQELVGGLGGTVSELPISDQRIAQELFWYIRPEFFSLRSFNLLIDGYEYWARLVGASEIRLNHMTHPRLQKLYERRGYQQTEVITRKLI